MKRLEMEIFGHAYYFHFPTPYSNGLSYWIFQAHRRNSRFIEHNPGGIRKIFGITSSCSHFDIQKFRSTVIDSPVLHPPIDSGLFAVPGDVNGTVEITEKSQKHA